MSHNKLGAFLAFLVTGRTAWHRDTIPDALCHRPAKKPIGR